MSIGENKILLYDWGVKAGMVHSSCGLITCEAGKTV